MKREHDLGSAWARAFWLAIGLFIAGDAHARAIPVFANGQRVSCQTCHTTFPGMTRYGMSVMMTNFQILNRHLQDQALPISARMYITSILANKDHPGTTQMSDLSLLGGGFLGRDFTWYAEQHIIDSGSIGATEQLWLSWNGLLHGTNSIQVGKFHTPFPFMPAHAWSVSTYLLAAQTSGQNSFNPDDARWGVAFNGMSNEFMYNVSWLTGSGPTADALNYNHTLNPTALDVNVSYGGMQIPWSVGAVGIGGSAPVRQSASYLNGDPFSREGLYLAYQDAAWHYQTMYYHGYDQHPDIVVYDVPLNGFFFEMERDFNWRNHFLVRYDVASSDTLNRQVVVDFSHNVLPNLALIGEVAAYPLARPQISFQVAYAGPYEYGRRFLANTHVVAADQSQPTPLPSSQPSPDGDKSQNSVNDGATLVQANGCAGCHGAQLKGGAVGPALYGIEHRLDAARIADFIVHPRAPMPNFGFNTTQVAAIVAYLSSLDGGGASSAPVVTFNPSPPTDEATITVRFPGTPAHEVSVLPVMQMGTSTMQTRLVRLQQSKTDPHTFTGRVVFSMGGPWTVKVQYDGQTLNVPLNVGQ